MGFLGVTASKRMLFQDFCCCSNAVRNAFGLYCWRDEAPHQSLLLGEGGSPQARRMRGGTTFPEEQPHIPAHRGCRRYARVHFSRPLWRHTPRGDVGIAPYGANGDFLIIVPCPLAPKAHKISLFIPNLQHPTFRNKRRNQP